MKLSYSPHFKRVLTLYSLGFFLVFGYAIARTCIDSLFLQHYTSEALPAAWLITSLVSVFVIVWYNRVNQRQSILKLYGKTSLICALMLIFLLATYFFGFVPAIFILYIWKEIYMVVLMETYWSFADIVFSIKTARYSYGIALAIANLGGILGNLSVGPAAKKFGSELTLCTLLIFLVLGFVIARLAKNISDEAPKKAKEKIQASIGIKVMRNSRYLIPLALLLVSVQIFTALVDFRFNAMLETNYVDTDLRTALLGQIHAAVNAIGISIQLFTAPILKSFGIGGTFRTIPFFLSALTFSFVLIPKFALMLTVKITSKSLDYSLFRAIKEILYIPLSREEKTQGKGIIDIFMYRLARGLSSIVLMAMKYLGILSFVMEASLLFSALWLMLAIVIVKRYRELIKEKDSLDENPA